MAARNPTDYTRWVDGELLEPNKPILASTLDAVFDDQEFALDAQMLVVSDCFAELSTTRTSACNLGTYYVETKDMCDVSGITGDQFDHDVYAYGWVDSGDTMSVKVDGDVSSDTVTGTTTSTSPVWFSVGTLELETNGTQEGISFSFWRSAGSGSVYIAGIAVFATET